MDISTLALLAVSAVAPLLQKGAEKITEKNANQDLEQRGKIWNLVKGMFADDDLILLNPFEQNPENAETQAELRGELEHLLKANSDIAEQIDELIKQIPHSQENQNTINQTENENIAGQDVSGSTVNRSKRSNDITQTGLGRIGIQGISGPTINVTQIIGKSYQYNDLLDQLKIQQKLFDRTPEDEPQERLKISAKINELTDRIQQFRQDVLKLAEAFQNIEINTERLKRAKEHFDRSEIGGARAVLEMELEQMQSEQKHLLREREHYETEILPKLQNNSEEFYLLALSTRSDYRNPNRFEDVRKYFQSSIESYPTKSNVFDYAYFLWEHNQFPEAEYHYNLYLEKFKNEIDKNEFANILNNLANLHSNQNNYDEALKEYEEALHIYRQLAETNPQIYLPDIAMTLNNLAILHRNQNKYNEALNKYDEALNKYDEALQIYRQLSETNPQTFLPDVAMTLNNLAILHQHQDKYDEASKEFEEAVQIRRRLAETNPQTYLPYMAITLNNLAVLNQYRNKYDEALNEYKEALQIRRQLAEMNPQTYLPDVTMTLINLSILYQNFLPDREKSIAYAVEAVMILLPIVEKVSYTQKYMETAMDVLADWDLNAEEIDKLVEEKRSAEIEN